MYEIVKEKFNASDSDVFITLLPGSRISEINRHFELFKQTINIVKVTQPNIKILLPTLPGLQNKLKSLTTDWGLPVHIVTSKEEKYSGFAASQAALAVSGTVALELAIACVPMVIAYKANFITAAIAKRIVKLPQVSLGNILMESEVCPEYLQEKATPFNLAYALNNLLDNEVSRSKQIELWKRIPEKLSAGPDAPSKYAAKIILDIIEK